MGLKKLRNGKWSSEHGSILAITGVGLLTFILAAGLCVDISHMYLVSAELQNAADAAALAGASALDSRADGITKAVDRAVATMNNYEFNKTGVTLARTDVRFAVNLSAFSGGGTGVSEADATASPSNIRFVQVTIPNKSLSVIFATQSLGGAVSMTKQAVAGQSVAINEYCNVGPLSVVEDDLTGAPLNVNPECPNQTVFTSGCTYTMRLGSNGNGGGSITAGNYLILALDGNGGADAREQLALTGGNCYIRGQEVSTEPGMTAGPIRQGINTRFDDYKGGLDPVNYPPDPNVAENITYDQYKANSPFQAPQHTPIPNRRILLFPIIKSSEYDNGRGTVSIGRIGAFFLRQRVPGGNGGDITAEYIGDRITVGSGGFNPGGAPGNPQLTVAVLYK